MARLRMRTCSPYQMRRFHLAICKLVFESFIVITWVSFGRMGITWLGLRLTGVLQNFARSNPAFPRPGYPYEGNKTTFGLGKPKTTLPHFFSTIHLSKRRHKRSVSIPRILNKFLSAAVQELLQGGRIVGLKKVAAIIKERDGRYEERSPHGPIPNMIPGPRIYSE